MYILPTAVVLVLAVCFVNAGFFGGGSASVNNEELYKLLGVSKTATTKQIRIAFKKLALEKHPDKNLDDPNANDAFIKINRAYEILKDEELRKKYDTYGEEGLKDNMNNQGHNYQSWNFYKQNFGIYDDDPEVVTLSRSDFKQFVESNENTIWFINFYSTQCSHCHELAPTWRDLAKQLDGAIKIGAVNCMDDWALCNEQQIQSFPSLVMYPKKQRFNDVKTIDNLIKFALSFASGNVHDLSSPDRYQNQLNKNLSRPWLISYCLPTGGQDTDNEDINYELNCLEESVLRKLAIMLHRLVRVASINCNKKTARENLCPRLKPNLATPVLFYSKGLPNISLSADDPSFTNIPITTSNYKLIVEAVLSYLPDIRELDESEFETVLANLREKSKQEKPWLIQFVNQEATASQQDLDLKKLPALLKSNYNFARLDCSKLKQNLDLCAKYQIVKYPTFVLFKSASFVTNAPSSDFDSNWYEIHYGNRQSADELASFVTDNARTHVRTLTKLDATFMSDELTAQGKQAFFVDFFAPWCPPCMHLLPEFRKAAKSDSAKSILFGTIDCTVNTPICEQYGIRSYPTTILFNNSVAHNYHGPHSSNDIADFIQDILKPSVVILNYDSFHSLVGQKPIGKIWLVDFYASWCGPCQQLAPEWRKLAKRVDASVVTVGQVDCVIEQKLCMEQGIQSYPNIRIYTADSKGFNRYDLYQGWMRDVHNLFQWVQNYMPSVSIPLDMSKFENMVLKSGEEEELPWMVDFYAPWCGHCQVFAPTFESLATKFEGKVKFGKVNCQEHQHLCNLAGIRAYPTIKFFPTSLSSGSGNWNAGENIQQYDFNSLFNTINDRVKRYASSSSSQKDKTANKSNEHSEL